MSYLLESLHRHQGARQLAKFSIVGCLNLAISLTVFILLYSQLKLGTLIMNSTGDVGLWLTQVLSGLGIDKIDAAVANTFSYAAGMMNSFYLNRLWTFEAKVPAMTRLPRFVLVNALSFTVSTLILLVVVDVLGAPYLPVLCATLGIVTIINFLGNKFWTFSDPLRHETVG
jgi:putative flippase GtrA